MRTYAWPVVLVCMALLVAEPVRAQTTRADTAAVLLDVATRLRQEGRASLSRSLLDLIVERYAGTPAAATAAQLRVQQRAVSEERSGRTELLVWSTVYGMALGAAIPAAFDAREPAAYGVGLLVGGPTGFTLGRAMTRGRPLSEGQARAITFGSIWGAWQAFGWREVFEIGDPEPECTVVEPDEFCFERDAESSTVLKATILGSVAGIGTGLLLARKPISSGTATTVNLGALWGSWFGVAAAILGDFDQDNQALTWTLLGGNAGLVATALLAPDWNLSRSRARLISISGVAGGLAGAGVLLIFEADGNGAVLMPLVGSIAGLALGTHWTRNYDERVPGDDDGSGSALLHWSDGAVKLGMPTVMPTLLRNESAHFTPALHVPLFQARW